MRSIYRKWPMALLQKLLSKFLNGGSRTIIIRTRTNGNRILIKNICHPYQWQPCSSPKTSAIRTNGIPILTKNICHPHQWQ
ncbi:hypothetical protein, partial [Prevotella corporis]|uniref:hypothetical protein n=1 Tax=Prevotella corporis TaxID=28128 RepID=UPI0012E3BACA